MYVILSRHFCEFCSKLSNFSCLFPREIFAGKNVRRNFAEKTVFRGKKGGGAENRLRIWRYLTAFVVEFFLRPTTMVTSSLPPLLPESSNASATDGLGSI
jgi:hypothetical protein